MNVEVIKARFEAKFIPEPNSGCWLWEGAIIPGGYGTLKVNRRTVGAHRVAWMLYRSPDPSGMFVLHKCDVRCCVNPDHLFLGTHQDNMADMSAKGRGGGNKTCGEDCHNARLTKEAVRWIRKNVGRGVTERGAARRFGVSRGAVRNVLCGETWGHVA